MFVSIVLVRKYGSSSSSPFHLNESKREVIKDHATVEEIVVRLGCSFFFFVSTKHTDTAETYSDCAGGIYLSTLTPSGISTASVGPSFAILRRTPSTHKKKKTKSEWMSQTHCVPQKHFLWSYHPR